MTTRHRLTLFAVGSALALTSPAGAAVMERAKTANGVVVGAPEENGVRAFRGIPFAAPPVGELRWKPPQPARNWAGARAAAKFGPRCMQRAVFGDMGFRSDGMGEDCLYLNVWTPAKSARERLPVLVYFYGGGYMAGDGSEPRYDGEVMARKGIVALTVNYRLGVFGFFAHPELTKESKHKASGNQGLLDQAAALAWVQKNIAAFGGDPKRVTIAGESAGSTSVSAQMASPLSKHLIAGAIGESGALINPTLAPVPLEKAEATGTAWAAFVSAPDLKALRAMTADALLEATGKPQAPRFGSTVDGYFLPRTPAEIFAAGEQAQVPLLAGWNSEENNYRSVLGQDEPTPENYSKAVARLYGDRAPEVLKAYPAFTKDEVMQVGTELASDRFIAFSTWKWLDLHSKTGIKPVYRYYYSRPRPAMNPEMGNATANLAGGVTRGAPASSAAAPAPPRPLPRGAVHSAEIEYAMGTLGTNKVYAWTPDDYKVSEVFQGFFSNFVKTGDPNGAGLPKWPAANRGTDIHVMRIDVDSKAAPDAHQHRYRLLDEIYAK
jgi:para-nitrobenzyl esterase